MLGRGMLKEIRSSDSDAPEMDCEPPDVNSEK